MSTTNKKLTATQKAYQALCQIENGIDADIRFVANVIFTSCSKPATKLKNLFKLLDAGCEVRSAQFDLFKIRVDGELHDINYLDNC